MDFKEYRRRGKQMVDYIADYLENIRDRRVYPDVKPGYMRNLLPQSAPIDGENWDAIFNDVERVIMPGVTHWQSPHMHAYFPALNSFPSLLGDMLADAINCLGFTWASSPACTELEIIVMNWLGKMIGLPDEFLHLNNNSKGGGVIQTTASEATLVCLLAGRTRAIRSFHERSPGLQDAEINARLVAYCSDQAHSSVEKAALIGLVRMRYIESDENLSMRGELLREAIEDDTKQGLIPFWVCGTLGTTGTCAFDNLEEIGKVCREYNLWLHLDAAYAGSAFICPEYRSWLKGVERADSIAFNPSKWLMVHFDCTALWVKDSSAVHRTFNVEPLYLQHENSGSAIDYMHWQIPLSKRFRSLKLWFVLRSFGIKGLQKHIREGVRLAQKFEALVAADHRFEIPAKRYLGMVVFRIKGENEITERVLKRLNHRGNIHCVPASIKGKYVIRFTVTSSRTTLDDILNDWSEIRLVTGFILDEMHINIAADRVKVPLKDTKEKSEAFGSSLLLANSPMSPKIVNGSFAAIFDADEFLAKTYAGIRIAHQESPSMRRRVRGILMSGKQFSLDSHMDIVVHTSIDSSTTSSTANAHGKTNPIREDNEDGWEAYESLGTPPNSPPPMISPLILTPSNSQNTIYSTAQSVSPTRYGNIAKTSPLQVGQCAVVRAPTRKPPNTLTLPTRNSYVIDNTVFMHNLETSMSFTRCYDTAPDGGHQCALSFTPSPLITPSHNRAYFAKTTSKSSNSSLCSPPAAGRSGSKRKNIHVYTCNGRQNSVRTQLKQEAEVYHGKRYLDPVIEAIDGCAFVNDGFGAVSVTARQEFRSNTFGCTMLPGIAETESLCSVDWEAVRSNFRGDRARLRRGSNSFPKFRIRINDEHGNPIQNSFDSTSEHGEGSFSPLTPTSPVKIIPDLAAWSTMESKERSKEVTKVPTHEESVTPATTTWPSPKCSKISTDSADAVISSFDTSTTVARSAPLIATWTSLESSENLKELTTEPSQEGSITPATIAWPLPECSNLSTNSADTSTQGKNIQTFKSTQSSNTSATEVKPPSVSLEWTSLERSENSEEFTTVPTRQGSTPATSPECSKMSTDSADASTPDNAVPTALPPLECGKQSPYSPETSTPEKPSPVTPAWTSLERSSEKSADGTIASNDGWTVVSSDSETDKKKFCQKCGHSTPSLESSSSSS